MRALVTMVTLLLLTLLLGLTAGADEIENLARNPDFEDGIVEWVLELHGDAGAVAELKVDKDGVVGDKCALVETMKLDGSGTWWHTGLNQNGHIVEAGVTYTLAFWAKSEVKRPICACMGENHDPWGNWNMQTFFITPEWQEYWVTWTSLVTDKNARIRIPTGQFKDEVWVDHVRLYEGTYKEEDLEGITMKRPVEPSGKLATTWAEVKAD